MRKGMRMPTVMQGHAFSRVPQAKIERSTFNRSHRHLTTFDAGYLIPIYVDEALPGDTFAMSCSALARLATPLKPIMDNLYMDFFFFAVPNRLIWNNWERFNGAQDDPSDSTSFVVPQFTEHSVVPGTLSDYMGIPGGTTVVSQYTFNSLHHRAYNLIWNEWFRDQNLQLSAVVDKDDGPDTITDYVLLRRGKRHDYFTSSLPWPQKGTAVTLPLGTSAPVVPAAGSAAFGVPSFSDTAGATEPEGVLSTVAGADPTDVRLDQISVSAFGTETLAWGNPALATDLSGATAATINELRQAFQVQKLLERDARGGTRYTEILKSHFGVTSPDARLQRPEYLGGGSVPVNVSPVAQTSRSDVDESPQGNLAGIGTVNVHGVGFTKSFTEHCVLLGLVSVRADLTYQQGMNRMFRRRTRYDYFWPALAHIGEQPVQRSEIYVTGQEVNDDAIWGYQERYAEYRYKPSLVTGLFRSDVAGSLDIWHLAQEYGSAPLLGASFIVDDPPVDRVIAVPDEPHFLFDGWFNLKCARPMPVFGVPGLIDHF